LNKLLFKFKNLFAEFKFKKFIANKSHRVQFTTAVFAVLLLIPLTPSINMTGQLGYFNKRVQVETYEGGVIDSIFVKEGDQVAAGQVLMKLSEVRIDGEYQAQLQQLAARLCHDARLTAMVQLSPFIDPVTPEWVSSSYLEPYCDAEKKLASEQILNFNERLKLQKNQLSELLRENESLERSVFIEGKRLEIQKDIYQKKNILHDSGFLSPLALLESNKELMDGEQRLAEKRADLSVRKEKLIELRRQIRDLETDYFDRARSERNALHNEIEMQKQRMQYLLKAHANFEVKAPQSGSIYGIKKNRQGNSFNPRDVVLEIVPNSEEMVVVASMPSKETSYVQQGQDAVIRMQTHNQSFAPEFKGRIIAISSDLKTDKPTDPPAYQVHLSFDCDAACVREKSLVSGMPVDVYVLGAKRSLLSYLLDAVLKGSRKVLSEPS
jgi:HlyD family type I secretion membrane fusion protein